MKVEKVSLQKESRIIGKSSCYFSVMKKQQQWKFKLCMRLGKGNLSKGYFKLVELSEKKRIRCYNAFFDEYDNSCQLARKIAEKTDTEDSVMLIVARINTVIYCTNLYIINQYKNARWLIAIMREVRDAS